MAGELLSSAAQSHIAEGFVKSHAVQAPQDRVGVRGFHKQVVLPALRVRRMTNSSSSAGACLLLRLEDGVHDRRRRAGEVYYLSHL